MTPTKLSIVLPVLDEAALIESSLMRLAPLRKRGVEVVVVDGGSADDTMRIARPHCDQLLQARAGRGRQMNAGARACTGDAILFLHADCRLPADADKRVSEALEDRQWGRFDVRIDSAARLLRVVSRLMNLRSRVTGIATGDQAIFVRRAAFLAVGGYREIALMEDIDLCMRLKCAGAPACLADTVSTSPRRWEAHGALRTIVLMWRLRLAFALGANPDRLARAYGYETDGR